jgi:DNA (cytosine-5)-methyltransferase 1
MWGVEHTGASEADVGCVDRSCRLNPLGPTLLPSLKKIGAKDGMAIAAIDLFCGAGGLTRGLEMEGVDVRSGIDVDPECRYPYEANNWARFVQADVASLTADDLVRTWDGAGVRLLAGCAPCQPFSTYTQGKAVEQDPNGRWRLLEVFGEMARDSLPELVTMENVPDLRKHAVYEVFLSNLKTNGYEVSENIVECEFYGVPQRRRRLVVLASRLGAIRLVSPEEFGAQARTVRDAIGHLPRIGQGEKHPSDPLHRASSLSPLNLRRIRASKPGGSWHDWDDALVAPCHAREKGKGYRSVYGRMEWDRPAPTITTQAYGFGSGRFGHPEQHRALSLREAALLQTFPQDYAFMPPNSEPAMKSIGRLIGNAVPVRLGRVVGRSMIAHVRSCGLSTEFTAGDPPDPQHQPAH